MLLTFKLSFDKEMTPFFGLATILAPFQKWGIFPNLWDTLPRQAACTVPIYIADVFANKLHQGILIEGEGSVQLTSSLR
jgi:hypothetical protein